ncbi:MAG: hypothetical protein Q8922_01880 [Bacteroidota bacterium]|nr:hypothetical protein [Bacteroidota bacterium]MDP4232023.1 hypothetical protein [Bacteroidota bacterium]MDP4241270.1 hypothetical protein [Bacteroidota bacterium]MDP4286662.1 hypothetical protein [Bacteroidota bacterium]
MMRPKFKLAIAIAHLAFCAGCLSSTEPGQLTGCNSYRHLYDFVTNGLFLFTDSLAFSLTEPSNPVPHGGYHSFGGDTAFVDSTQPSEGYSFLYWGYRVDSLGTEIQNGRDIALNGCPRHVAYRPGVIYMLRHTTYPGGNMYFCAQAEDTVNALDVESFSDTLVTLQSEVPLTDPQDIAITGNILYVLDGAVGLQIFSLSDPMRPVLIATIGSIQGYHMDLTPQTTLLVHTVRGIAQYDISNPTSPVLLSMIL